MEWYFSHRTRAQLVKNLTEQGEGGQTLAYKIVNESGQVILWAVQQCSPDHPEYPNQVFISCYLLGTSGRLHGYRPMDESMHPYFYSCPIRYLAMAPVRCQAWRDGVMACHDAATQKETATQ